MSGHTSDQIIFIGSEKTGHRCTWGEFLVLADREYDHSYGSPKVATDLIIVFDDGHKMWREEYDGLEWWRYSTPFVVPKESRPITSLIVDGVGWKKLSDLNK